MEEAVEGEEHCCGSEDRKRRTGGAGGAEEGHLEEKSRKVCINDRNSYFLFERLQFFIQVKKCINNN